MKSLLTLLFFPLLLGLSHPGYGMDESQADDMADLTAVFIYLKNDCGYQEIPDQQIRNALIFFAGRNRWDLSNYNRFDMQRRGEASYQDLSGIAVATDKKCHSLAENTLGMLAYMNK